MFINVLALASNKEIHYANKVYLLYLLGCTLFVDKIGIMVSVTYLAMLDDLSLVGIYAWEAVCWHICIDNLVLRAGEM